MKQTMLKVQTKLTDNAGETKEDVVDADFEEVKDNEEKKDAS